MPRHVVAAYAPGPTSPLDLGAVTEVFGVDPEFGLDWYEFVFCGPRAGRHTTRGGLHLAVDAGADAIAGADTVVVMPVERFVGERPSDDLLAPLLAASARGCRIMAVCLGTFVLAAAGLLDERRATTHWRFCGDLAAAYPRVDVVPDVLYVDEGDVLTSGGVAAGIDLCLHVVRKDYGAEVANSLARRLVFGPHREGGQAQFVEKAVPAAPELRLAPAISWALQHLAEDPAVDHVAAKAAMSRRTFYREFQATMGTTPRRWLDAQKMILARQILETTDLTVPEVARQSGFRDPSILRSHFTRHVGVSPTSYRRQFGRATAS